MIVLDQSSFHTTWASLFEMQLEPNSLDWNGCELGHELELEEMKPTLYKEFYDNFSTISFHKSRTTEAF